MKNLLIGNGINIQFGGIEYCNKNIIDRALKTLKNNKYNPKLYSIEVGEWLKLLHKEYKNLLNGLYDIHAFTSDEKKFLIYFKKRYKILENYLEVDEIGFEDYFLIHDLFCRKNKIQNPNKCDIRELLKRLFLDSIYNNGNIQILYENFPSEFKFFLEKFDSIFTTNYDNNVEVFSNKMVFYLHGAFHVLDEVYNQNSLRNKLTDAPVKETPVIKGYEHLFSNALITYSGNSKAHHMKMISVANNALFKATNAFNQNEFEIESLLKSDIVFLKNLAEVVKLQSEDSSLSFNEYYPIKEFKKIKGTIDIIGLSPNNDNHLFDIINSNSDLQRVRFYYYNNDEIKYVKKVFRNLTIELFDARKLWKSFYKLNLH